MIYQKETGQAKEDFDLSCMVTRIGLLSATDIQQTNYFVDQFVDL
jgi:hypothetical protein